MFEVVTPVPGLTLFCFDYAVAGAHSGETTRLFAHSSRNIVCQ